MKPLAPNSLIQNRYLIVHLIGKGGMGEVYLAVDQRLGSAVALKRTFFADDEMLGGAFEREARTLARLRHPVLPKVSDHFTENGEQYLVMEHIAGDDLAKRLEGAQKPFPLSWVLFWADQLLDALAYLHTHEPPIIHRDIKPQNLKLTDENHIVLLDFGLSKNTGQTKISGSSSSGSSGSVVGYTPHYAPMEQIRGTGTNPRSDIYSLSATLYQLMTNTVPADALTRADALLNGDADPIKPLDQINPEVPSEVSEVILHGMEVSQEKRFSTAKEMQKALRKAFSQMQEAMSAQTIAFAAPEVHSSKIEQPVGAMHSLQGDKLGDADSKATQLRDESVEAERFPAVSLPQTADATAHYTSPTDAPVRQADVKTEVYNAGSNPLYVPDEPAPTPTSHDFTPAVSKAEDWSVTTDNQNGDFPAPDATVANLDLGASSPASPYGANETFSSPAPSSADAFATRVPDETPDVPVNSPPRPAPVVVQKKKSKAVWVVGGLAVLFFMGIVAAGAGWFVYSQYYASAAVAPTPSPEPTFAATPTPEPTFEAVTNSNSNSSIATLDSNSNTNTNIEVLTVQPTPTPLSQTETATREPNPGVKQTQQTDTKKTTPVKTSTPVAAKPTPKKSDRTVILQ